MSFIKPEVYAQLVTEKFKGRVKVMQLAQDLGEIDGFKEVGETIVFPKWKLINLPTEMTKGTALVPEELGQESSTATIKQVGKAIRVYDSENLTALGNQVDQGVSQTSTVFARKLDDDLVAEMKKAPFKSTIMAEGNQITDLDLQNAMLNFGDDRDVESFAGIIINSLLINSFYKMPNFVSKDNHLSVEGNGIQHNGLLGYYNGIPVFVSDKSTYDEVKKECITFIIKKGALGYKMKREMNVETDREVLTKSTLIATDMIYAVKLIADDGVVVIKKTPLA